MLTKEETREAIEMVVQIAVKKEREKWMREIDKSVRSLKEVHEKLNNPNPEYVSGYEDLAEEIKTLMNYDKST